MTNATDANEGLRSRLIWTTALRLAILTVLLGIVTAFYFGDRQPGFGYSAQITLLAIGAAFAVAGISIILARRRPEPVAYAQLIFDQLIFTTFAYVSGGVSSGATAFFGLTCLAGAALVGTRGVIVAATTALASLTLMSIGFVSGILRPPHDQSGASYPTTWSAVSYPLLLNLLALAVVALLAGYLADRIRHTGGALVAATARADEAERLALLGRFAAGLAHEIRNPLGSIAASVDMLASTPGMSRDDRLLCEIISREASRVNDLVGDMLQIAKPRPPVRGPVDVAAVAREVVVLASRSGRGADVPLEYEGPVGGIVVSADGAQLRQILWNLVRNAIQASAASDIVHVRVRAPSAEAGVVAVVEVEDEGPGIAQDAREQIFDAFFTTRTNGLGVGLAVVKRLVDDHGWRIDVVSEAGKGACFQVAITGERLAPVSIHPWSNDPDA